MYPYKCIDGLVLEMLEKNKTVVFNREIAVINLTVWYITIPWPTIPSASTSFYIR